MLYYFFSVTNQSTFDIIIILPAVPLTNNYDERRLDMNNTTSVLKERADKSKKIEEAAELFSRLSDKQKDAMIKLVKELSKQNK